MGQVHQFTPRHFPTKLSATAPRVAFTQDELRQIFDVYSRRVSTGEWRDYGISHVDGRAIFSVFRHSSDQPLLAIEKRGASDTQFALLSGLEKIKRSKNLPEVLAAVPETLRLVVNSYS